MWEGERRNAIGRERSERPEPRPNRKRQSHGRGRAAGARESAGDCAPLGKRRASREGRESRRPQPRSAPKILQYILSGRLTDAPRWGIPAVCRARRRYERQRVADAAHCATGGTRGEGARTTRRMGYTPHGLRSGRIGERVHPPPVRVDRGSLISCRPHTAACRKCFAHTRHSAVRGLRLVYDPSGRVMGAGDSLGDTLRRGNGWDAGRRGAYYTPHGVIVCDCSTTQ